MTTADGQTEALLVVGVSARVRNDDAADIERLWERFRTTDVAARVPAKLSDDIYCVYHAYEGDQRDPFQMTIGCKVPDGAAIPDNLGEARVPAQPVVIYDASGEQPATLIQTWQKIWNSDIPRAFSADFEIHDSTDPNSVTIHVGVKR